MEIDFTESGPLFDGRFDGMVDSMLTEIEAEVAQRGVDMIQSELGTVLRHPTGFYRSHIIVEHDNIITDSGVIYGPWLEGTSSRNARSRFRGYSVFRRMKQRLSNEWTRIAQPIVDRWTGSMNG